MSVKSLVRSITPAPIWNAAGAVKRKLVTPSRRSFAANGEDLLVEGWLRNYGCDFSRVRYVDIGANHPKFLSNTFMFYEAGASGILVEPDPDNAELLRSKRPRDIVVNSGVAFDERRSATLFRITSSGFNTFSRSQADFAIQSSRQWPHRYHQEIVGEITVPLVPINEIISKYAIAPDFVSIDTESLDLPILRTLDLSLLNSTPGIPTLICIEASSPLADFAQILNPAGFEFTAQTPDNWIFRRYIKPI